MALPSPVADAAAVYAAQQRILVLAAIRALANAAGSPRDAEGWRDLIATLAPTLLALQVAAAAQADAYLAAVLAAQGADPAADAVTNPAAFADLTDGGGSWMRLLVFAPLSSYRDARAAGQSPQAAAAHGRTVANSIVLTGMQDTGRAAVQTAMHTRSSVRAYVRVLRRPSCARCVILAGRLYRTSRPFQRHKRCDCTMAPSAMEEGDWATDPEAYFRSLSADEQDATFGVGGARAIREGADMSQVVNAYQGVQTVTVYRRELRVTTSGTTRRGLFGGYEIQPDGRLRRRTGDRPTPPRLLPDQIFQLADDEGWDRDRTLAALRRFAYIL